MAKKEVRIGVVKNRITHPNFAEDVHQGPIIKVGGKTYIQVTHSSAYHRNDRGFGPEFTYIDPSENLEGKLLPYDDVEGKKRKDRVVKGLALLGLAGVASLNAVLDPMAMGPAVECVSGGVALGAYAVGMYNLVRRV